MPEIKAVFIGGGSKGNVNTYSGTINFETMTFEGRLACVEGNFAGAKVASGEWRAKSGEKSGKKRREAQREGQREKRRVGRGAERRTGRRARTGSGRCVNPILRGKTAHSDSTTFLLMLFPILALLCRKRRNDFRRGGGGGRRLGL